MDIQNSIEWICKFREDELTYYIGEGEDADSNDGYVYYVSKIIDDEEIVYKDKYKSLVDFPELLNGDIEEEAITQAEGNLIASKVTEVSLYLTRKNERGEPCYLMYVAEDGIACAEIKNGVVTREMTTNDVQIELDEEEGKKKASLYICICTYQGGSSIISKKLFEKQWSQGYVSTSDFIKRKW